MMFPTTGEPLSGRQMRRDDQMLYLMIKPYAEQAAHIDGLRREHGLSRKYVVERIHMTLVPFGDIRTLSPQTLERIRRAVESLQAEPFEVTLNRIKGNALVGSRMRTLRDFQRALVTRLEALGVYLPDYAFNPHASLTYEEWQPRNIMVSPIRWRVEQLLLINSIHGHGHELLDSWALEPRQGSLF
jgi:RNA 2',3'-cyclic 3'-phosphodiesterase